MKFRTSAVFAMILLLCGSLVAEEWGDIKGTFVFDGEIPSASKIKVEKDAAVCGIHNLVDESLVVNGENKGIANIIVYMYLASKDSPPPVHESYKETESGEVVFDNLNCEFVPRVALLRTSQTLLVGNKDSVGHNTNMSVLNFNPIVPANGQLKKQFSKSSEATGRS